MRITEKTYDEIMQSIGRMRPEEGGALFSDDGGRTVTRFEHDRRGDRSGTTYSPNTGFINALIQRDRSIGSVFVGIVHTHPCTNVMSRGGYGNGHTASDEEAFVKLLRGMKGTRKLYFPIIGGSTAYGAPSMRVYVCEKDCNDRIAIYEEGLEIVRSNDAAACMSAKALGGEKRRNQAVLFAGAKGRWECAERLAREGVSTFVFADASRYDDPSELRGEARAKDIKRYVADCFAERVSEINPASNCRSVREDLSEIDDESFERLVRTLDCEEMVVYIAATDKKVRERALQLMRSVDIAVVEVAEEKDGVKAYVSAYKQKERIKCAEAKFPDGTGEKTAATITAQTASEAVLKALDSVKAARTAAAATLRSCGNAGRKSAYDLAGGKWESLYPREEMERKVVVVVGCGGSRSYIEDMARHGVRKFVLIDGDTYSESNLQTQMCYADEMGRNKAEAIAASIRRLDPSLRVVALPRMLDESITDETFAAWVGEELTQSPHDVLIAGCTDNFRAQARCSRLALKYGCPYIQAGIAEGGRVQDIEFFHPAVSHACPRCILEKRYRANLGSEGRRKAAVSDGTSVFFTEALNANKGFISLALLLYHAPGTDPRFSEFLDDNKWPAKKFGKKRLRYDRNLMFYTYDCDITKHTGRKKTVAFDKWGRKLGSRYQAGLTVFSKTKPAKGCPDCGGTGDLAAVKGRIRDTREGIYPAFPEEERENEKVYKRDAGAVRGTVGQADERSCQKDIVRRYSSRRGCGEAYVRNCAGRQSGGKDEEKGKSFCGGGSFRPQP